MSIPRATARLQLHRGFNFDRAAEVVPYCASLGISHIYASPILAARSGSMHGYDIVDPTRINPELGGEEGLRRLVARVREAGMGLIQDIVPNHMGVGAENPWWQHVLEWGEDSPYADWFDIDWHPADETLDGKVLAPFLGKPYGDALGAGEIRLRFDAARGKFFVSYYAHAFPVAPADYAGVLRAVGSPRMVPAIGTFEERRRNGGLTQHNADIGFGLLRELAQSPEGRADIDAALAAFSPDTPRGFDALHALLESQHYRLAWWRCAADGLNWRRFFEITDLIGMRVEQDDVFEARHGLIFRLYTEGLIDGLRIDHVDGLADPGGYCRKLRRRLQALSSQRPPGLPPGPAYIVVEKILAPGEQLRQDWEVDGTSGYDFMDCVGALLHDPAGEAPLSALWEQLSGRSADFRDEVRLARRQLLANNLAGEFEGASRALHALARTDLHTRDFSLGAIRRVFGELLVHFPVYRTYADRNGHDEQDQQVFEQAWEAARHSVDRTEAPLLDTVARWLGGEAPGAGFREPDAQVVALHKRAITRFQQLTPPLAAKSVEDTAFYRYGRLLSRNEVGSDPAQFALSVQEFHDANGVREARFPSSMLATATHDHKRGEDVRARIAVLSEIAPDWERTVRDWMEMNAPLRSEVAGDNGSPSVAPHAADELMLYQMLAGAWPIGLEPADSDGVRQLAQRIEAWQTKALREAKQVSDWVLPNEEYEAACRSLLYALVVARPENSFLPALADFAQRIAPAGVVNSLAQTVLRLTSPGVPDLYQGAEFWDFSLVDPDNRSPVDYAQRIAALGQLEPSDAPPADAGDWRSGRLKQRLIRDGLHLRADCPELFSRGEYLPLEIAGAQAGHAIGFARRLGQRVVVVLATLRAAGLLEPDGPPLVHADAWADTCAMLGAIDSNPAWKDVYTGATVRAAGGRMALADALARLPVALLVPA